MPDETWGQIPDGRPATGRTFLSTVAAQVVVTSVLQASVGASERGAT